MLRQIPVALKPSRLSSSHAFPAVRSSSSVQLLRIPLQRSFSSSLPQTLRNCSSISSRAPATSHRSFSSSATMAASTRTETDAFGPLEVESDKYWGAQTQRSLGNFKINQPQDRMPEGVVRAFGILKGAAATVNMRYGLGRRTAHAL